MLGSMGSAGKRKTTFSPSGEIVVGELIMHNRKIHNGDYYLLGLVLWKAVIIPKCLSVRVALQNR